LCHVSHEFDDKVVLVTGSNSGIGRQTVIEFAKRGAQVVVTGRNVTRIGLVVQECDHLSPNGLNALGVAADITVDSEVGQMVKIIVSTFGKLDVLVNNAGATSPTNIDTSNLLESYDRIMSTNLRGALVLTREAVPHLIKSKGKIVNVASIAGHRPVPERLIYCSSKAALLMMTKTLALELGPKGVRVNSVSPGVTDTEFDSKAGFKSDVKQVLGMKTPLGRIGETQDMAQSILFLSSDRSSFITGSDIITDGGLSLS
jgi:NAD(P)-dependent dehydrogenase (short-subunit alcohol dehydrogenase family)